MSAEDVILAEIMQTVGTLPEAQRDKVMAAVRLLRAAIEAFGDEGAMALALVGAEKAAAC